MCFSSVLVLLSVFGSACCVQYRADFNMAGVMGSVQFDSSSLNATANLTGAGSSCSSLNLSLSTFPVMYGSFRQPCLEAHIGVSIFEFSLASPMSTISVPGLFSQMPDLDALTLTVTTCDGAKSCTVVRRDGQIVRTWRAKFFSPVAGNMYFRQTTGVEGATMLADLYYVHRTAAAIANVSVLTSVSSAASCKALLSSSSSANLANQTSLGSLNIGSPVTPVKSRLHISSFDGSSTHYVLLHMSASNSFECARLRVLEEKVVKSQVDMRGIKGYFMFRQSSPFHTTMLQLNLTNLRSMVGPYHVHHFPLPDPMSPPQSRCSNNNIGGHWNPFDVDVASSAYPSGPGSTHDLYEVGDLSAKHGFLTGITEFQGSFEDWNLPLFGRNSIVGRSMVIHEPTGARFVCSSIGYPGPVTVGRAVFQYPVVGTVLLAQLTSDPDSDVSVFLDLSYGMASAQATRGHNWHIHMYPISSEMDEDRRRCGSTGPHWNPFNMSLTDGFYDANCKPESPFACEIGDVSSKHRPLDLGPEVGVLATKSFFTDTTLWLSGETSAIDRSVVFHAANGRGPRIACANLTLMHFPSATTTSWHGSGTATGSVRFSQDSPQGPTNVKVSLSNLGGIFGGYHVHVLPIVGGRSPCDQDNVMGHFNPFSIDTAMDPAPGVGTTDEYEVGDMSGKFGLLTGQAEFQGHFMDGNMPMTGPNSVIGRSVVLHSTNGSRLQCSDIVADTSSGAEWSRSRATFRGTISGTITMSQLGFSDGSYGDTMMEVDLRMNSRPDSTEASWFLAEHYVGDDNTNCSVAGSTYNPFNMTEQSSTCSADSPLNCVVGDLTGRHGNVSLTHRQLFIDRSLQMSGDFTAIYRSVVLRQGSDVISCAVLHPMGSYAQQVFPKVTTFSRYDFRWRVSNVLNVSLARVTILPAPQSVEGNESCQQVTFSVSGNVSSGALDAVKTSSIMGQFQDTPGCRRESSPGSPPPTVAPATASSSGRLRSSGRTVLMGKILFIMALFMRQH